MRTFSILWCGQMISTIGSYMTAFTLTIWVWELTGQATALALVGFFTQVPRVLISPLAGVIVDRYNRKLLMMVGDGVAAFSSLAMLLLFLTGHLQVWHLYLAGLLEGTFGQIQELAATASITMVVPKQHYTRAMGMISTLHYGSNIIAPALASVLYSIIGLSGILSIDLITFAVAVSTLLFVDIPQPHTADSQNQPQSQKFSWKEIIFGFQYIFDRPSLLALMIAAAMFQFAHDLGAALYAPMILARSGNNTQLLGSVAAAAGIGGVIGAILVSTWGVPKQKIHGLLLGMIGAGLSKIVFGLNRIPLILIVAQFCSSLNFPLMGSCRDAIWLSKINHNLQGRVFAARSTIMLITSAIAPLIAGFLADQVLEPAMMPGESLANIFGSILGTGRGAGIALLYVLTSVCLLLIGLGGYTFKNLREVENNLLETGQ
ncbi:major facilitator superfamily MFS_1 [Crinalium epipsammum PCC 9333]|uniref:Major facilitator superfamily MFS_1 n=1 Tax=Crinalium epipsammum PCC 9333 TaxID=1173022 RepID=K9VT66_9CYAN|nr:major facilitator superfamily MFS_1 [Crinalium epipsammum PCC 9333]